MDNLEKQRAEERISDMIFKEMDDINEYADEVRAKLSGAERVIVGMCPNDALKEEKPDYPNAFPGNLKKRIDETRSILKDINRLADSLLKF